MAVRILPHREAEPTSVNWGGWWTHLNGERAPAEQLVNGWDYSTPISFEIQPSVDEDMFLRSTGLPSLYECDVVAICECVTTGYRFQSRRALAELTTGPDKVVVIEPPLGTLAHKVTLSASIVLSRSTPRAEDDIAAKKGARLASSPRQSVDLEGSGARFPTEAVPFSSLGYPSALWSIHCDFSDAEEPFTTSVRLYVNTEHPRSLALLDPSHPENRLLQSALETDTVRQMLRAAAVDEEQFRAGRTWHEGSSGEALENLAALFFGKNIQELISMQRTDTAHFERFVQARMNFFGTH